MILTASAAGESRLCRDIIVRNLVRKKTASWSKRRFGFHFSPSTNFRTKVRPKVRQGLMAFRNQSDFSLFLQLINFFGFL